MPIRQPRRNAVQWQTLILRQEHSGLNAQEYCEAENLSYPSFIQWRRRLRVENPAVDNADGGFVELTKSPIAIPLTTTVEQDHDDNAPIMLELSLGAGIELRLSRTA